MTLERAKGTRDFSPEDKILRNKITEKIKNAFELYGFSPLETPILERYETLTKKFAAGQESDVMKEIFKLRDQGKRLLALRFDLTVPLARYISQNPNIKLPFKRYQIGRTFRDGPIKLGRYREFWQCDADIVGIKGVEAEAELFSLTKKIYEDLNLKIKIKLNSRKILNGFFEDLGIKNQEKRESLMITIDKLYKLGQSEVKKELLKKTNKKVANKIMNFIKNKSINQIKLKSAKAQEGIQEIKQLLDYCKLLKIKVDFDLSLVRGLGYYTGTVFEIILEDSKLGCSVGGGGRYDEMIGNYTGRGTWPAIGISLGLDTNFEVLKKKEKTRQASLTKVYIIPIKTLRQSMKLAEKLRQEGINTDLDLANKNIKKNLDYANKQGIPYTIFLGKEELKKKKIKLRDMKTGKERLIREKQLIKILK